jgi:hypothetical protein
MALKIEAIIKAADVKKPNCAISSMLPIMGSKATSPQIT